MPTNILSLIIPILNEMQPERAAHSAPLTTRLRDLDSFFKPFQIEVEAVFVIDPFNKSNAETSETSLLEKYEFQKIKAIIIANNNRIGRYPSVAKGILAASGNYLIPFSMDMPISLSDLFSIYQELAVNSNFDFVLGNRFTSRKKRHGLKSHWHKVLEDIVLEKTKLKFKNEKIQVQDPLTPVWGFKKEHQEPVIKILSSHKGWYPTPYLISELTRLSLRIYEQPITFRDDPHSRIPLFREFMRNLF